MKHLSIFLGILLLLMNNLTCYKPYFNRVKQYDGDTVYAYIRSVKRKYQTPGYRGIHLGMTHDELNRLIHRTPWGYSHKHFNQSNTTQDYYDPNWPDQPQFKSTNFLQGDNTDWGPGWLSVYDNSLFPSKVSVDFDRNRLVQISLLSPMWDSFRVETWVKEWGERALSEMIQEYGQPTFIMNSFDGLRARSFNPGSNVNFYRWDMTYAHLELNILEKDGNYGCVVVLRDRRKTSSNRIEPLRNTNNNGNHDIKSFSNVKIIKVLDNYVLIDTDKEIGRLGEIIGVYRVTNQVITEVGKIQLVKIQDQKTAGRIVSNSNTTTISVGDIVRKRSNQ